jgi:renalase
LEGDGFSRRCDVVKISVVGAGIAGLAAARSLVDRKHHVTVFERAQVPGGRVGTKVINAIELPRGLSGELAFDHGAQYFTVRDQRFSELAAEWERDRILSKWTGRIVVFDGEGWEEIEDETNRYVGTPGMSAIPTAMASGLDIRYGQRIESLDPLLRDFDRVILALPAPEARGLLGGRDHHSTIRNDPSQSSSESTQTLPTVIKKSDPAEDSDRDDGPDPLFRSCWTVMAAFEERVPARFDAAFVNGSAVSWIARNSSKPKRNWKIDTWVIQASPTWSDAHVDDQPDDVGAFLMEAFEDLIAAGLPRAFFATVHRWRHASAEPPLAVGAIHDAASRITLCGDWCKGPRIEDAYLSGLQAADCLTA